MIPVIIEKYLMKNFLLSSEKNRYIWRLNFENKGCEFKRRNLYTESK